MGVEKAIAANGLTRERDGLVERYPGVPFCICAGREESAADNRTKSANLDAHVKTFGTFEQRPGTEAAYESAWKFAFGSGFNILLLNGPSGTGKSHLLQAIGWQCLDAGVSVRYELVTDMLERMKASFNPNNPSSYDDIVKVNREAQYLLLDDIGVENPTDWVIEKLFGLVDERYRNGRRLAVATNLSKQEIARRLGERMASRLWDVNTVQVATMACTDYRTGARW